MVNVMHLHLLQLPLKLSYSSSENNKESTMCEVNLRPYGREQIHKVWKQGGVEKL